jgi:hypothetical protein
MKRSDLTTAEALTAVHQHGYGAFEYLSASYPVKVVRAAFARDDRAGLLEYGVSADRPWLTPAGQHRLTDANAG